MRTKTPDLTTISVAGLAALALVRPCASAGIASGPEMGESSNSSFFDVQRERVETERESVESGWIGSLGVGFDGRTFGQEAIPVTFSFEGGLEKRFLGRLGIDLGGSVDSGSAMSSAQQSLLGFGVSAGLPVFLLNTVGYDLSVGPRVLWSRASWISPAGNLPLSQTRAGAAVGVRVSGFMARIEYDPFGSISGGTLTSVPSASLSLVFWDPLRF